MGLLRCGGVRRAGHHCVSSFVCFLPHCGLTVLLMHYGSQKALISHTHANEVSTAPSQIQKNSITSQISVLLLYVASNMTYSKLDVLLIGFNLSYESVKITGHGGRSQATLKRTQWHDIMV